MRRCGGLLFAALLAAVTLSACDSGRSGSSVSAPTPLEFERGAMKSRLTFRSDGTIAGLFILVP